MEQKILVPKSTELHVRKAKAAMRRAMEGALRSPLLPALGFHYAMLDELLKRIESEPVKLSIRRTK